MPSTRIKPRPLQPFPATGYFARFYIDLLKFGIGYPGSPAHPKPRKISGFEVVNDDQGCVIRRDGKFVEISESMPSGLNRGNRII